uniref:Uncharacterized protein n=1 Tax=Arundo donax TaxID=35708 RepID=A0A0A8YY75_ARUDO
MSPSLLTTEGCWESLFVCNGGLIALEQGPEQARR